MVIGHPAAVLACCSLLASPVAIEGRPGRPLVAATWVHTKDVQQSLSEVLGDALGSNKEGENGGQQHRASDVHLDLLRKQLASLFLALPKNEKGLLAPATVRYALHRHFVHHHVMYVKGLEPAGDAWNSSSPTDILEDRVPRYVLHLIEEQLHDGFGLKELALLAAALEHFVHVEAMQRLSKAYRVSGVGDKMESRVSPSELETVIDAYMLLFLTDISAENMSPQEFAGFVTDFSEEVPSWADTQAFVREVQREVLEKEQGGEQGPHGGDVSLELAQKVVEVILERFGKHQDGGCRDLAKLLIAHEDHGSGRVALSQFYQAGWQFRESKAYLSQFGAIDAFRHSGTAATGGESYVIIPNYLSSMPNCLASSSLYSVCCLNPCENILRHLEARVKAPTSTPKELLHLVAATPSDTVPAPRILSDSMGEHLEKIAKNHRGRVPLHGRLFAMWLHHAYPRECPYPAKSGTTRPLTADAWLESQNLTTTVSDEEVATMTQQAESVRAKDLVDGNMEDTLPWDNEEELVYHHAAAPIVHELQVLVGATAMIGLLFTLANVLVKVTLSLNNVVDGHRKPKAMV